jgi:hypothetical protein
MPRFALKYPDFILMPCLIPMAFGCERNFAVTEGRA